jgi:hypothetical protein
MLWLPMDWLAECSKAANDVRDVRWDGPLKSTIPSMMQIATERSDTSKAA